MGLKTQFARGYFASVGQYIRGNWYPSTAPGADPHVPLLYRDPVACCLADTIMPYGFHNVEDLVGHYRTGGDKVDEILQTKPDTSRYDGNADYLRFGGFMTNVMMAAQLLNGRNAQLGRVPSREKNTSHVTVHGTIGPKLQAEDWFADVNLTSKDHPTVWGTSSLPGTGFSCLPVGKYERNVYHYVSGSEQIYVHSPMGSVTGPKRTTPGTLKEMVSGIYWGPGSVYAAPWGGRIQLKSLSYDWLPGKYLTVAYSLSYWHSDPSEIGYVDFTCSMMAGLSSPRVGSTYPVNPGTSMTNQGLNTIETWSAQCTRATSPDRARAWFGSMGVVGASQTITVPGNAYFPTLLMGPVCATSSGDSVIDLTKVSRWLHPHRFSREVDLVEGDIRCSLYQSTVNAMEELEGSLDTNLFEQLAGSASIASYLPRMKDALKILKSLHGHDLPGTVKGVVDLATELRLRVAFQYAPDLDFVVTTLPELAKLAQELSVPRNKVVVSRGVFNWDFPPGEFYRDTCTLESRTKIVAVQDSSSFIARALGVDAMGLLPSAANAWDLVPLSFVVDWFVDIGARLDDLEKLSLLAALGPSYLVHSLRVKTPLSDEELAKAGVQSWVSPGVGLIPCEWVWYRRYVSRHIPAPRSGRYDFRMPTSVPNWSIAGSLGWKLLS